MRLRVPTARLLKAGFKERQIKVLLHSPDIGGGRRRVMDQHDPAAAAAHRAPVQFMTCIMACTLLFPMAAQESTPMRLRARLVSIIATTNIVLGALGPMAVGGVSERLKGHPEGPLMRWPVARRWRCCCRSPSCCR